VSEKRINQSRIESLTETFVQAVTGAGSGFIFLVAFGDYFQFNWTVWHNLGLASIHFTIGMITGLWIRRKAVKVVDGRHQSQRGSLLETAIKYALNFVRGILVNGAYGWWFGIPIPVVGNLQFTLLTTLYGMVRSYMLRRLFEAYTHGQLRTTIALVWQEFYEIVSTSSFCKSPHPQHFFLTGLQQASFFLKYFSKLNC
jgi:hypothetical protein